MYKIRATEKNNQKTTEFETKSMLYLMNYYKHSKEIKYFVIDFYNDVTGVDGLTTKCFDVQSKGQTDLTPYMLGQYLLTLFLNYLSEFNFEEFILFVEGVSVEITNFIGKKKVFNVHDLNSELVSDIIKGLEKSSEKKYVEDKSKFTKDNITKFLENVIFIIDNRSIVEYIKDAVQFRSSLIIDDNDLIKIFKEIKNQQSSKKNINLENKEIESIGCFLNYDKFLVKEAIQQFILNRICFKTAVRDISRSSVPKLFLKCIDSVDPTTRDELILECENDIFRLLYNKNNKKSFWALFEEVVINIKDNPGKTVDEIYELIDKEKVRKVRFLSIMSCKYYIALIKERIK